MPPKSSNSRKRKIDGSDAQKNTTVSRRRTLTEPVPASPTLPYPIAAFLRFPNMTDWADNYPLVLSENSPVPRSVAMLVALTLATSLDTELKASVWATLPGWNILTAAPNGQILSIQHQETGFRADPRTISYLYGRLAANLGVMVTAGTDVKIFLPNVNVEDNHVFAGNRQASFTNLTQEKIQIADAVFGIVKDCANELNRMSIARLAQTTVNLLCIDKPLDLASLVTLLEQSKTVEFYAKVTEFLNTLEVMDGSKAPLVSAILIFGVSTLTNTQKYEMLLKMRAKLPKRSLTSFATNLTLNLPVKSQAIQRYTIKNQIEIPQKSVDKLAKEDLVILGSQASTGDAVVAFLEKPPSSVYCATANDMILYFKSKSDSVSETIAGPLGDLKLSVIEGNIISSLCTKPDTQKQDDAPPAPVPPVELDSF